MPGEIDSLKERDHWSSGHDHLRSQGRLGEIHRDFQAVHVKDERGRIIQLFKFTPKPGIIQRLTRVFLRK